MSEKNIEQVEIEPLTDDELESVAGGLRNGSSDGCCSCTSCSAQDDKNS